MNKEFCVLAGKYEEEQTENIKVSYFFNTLEEAEKFIVENKLTSYPFCRVEIYYN
ncbi:hypothetical protein PSI22_20695 [Xenorhabdus sp. XENO-7]|uniref:Phage protein n=1 Tax=Xenorhabdus aichiensis TaxID=3025874 RepID=A0ABT5MCI3_9GAMM|nr:hypothetical protein [Xenorhabdus aichiensis]MDC9623968.1 hypothetical protein [Xenorhabdus aichiensis]MDC9623981.1 hypothetical protein [Xenorhabdus aichiensis]